MCSLRVTFCSILLVEKTSMIGWASQMPWMSWTRSYRLRSVLRLALLESMSLRLPLQYIFPIRWILQLHSVCRMPLSLSASITTAQIVRLWAPTVPPSTLPMDLIGIQSDPFLGLEKSFLIVREALQRQPKPILPILFRCRLRRPRQRQRPHRLQLRRQRPLQRRLLHQLLHQLCYSERAVLMDF